MSSALDVAAFILKEAGPMTAVKLQKLVYYCQAWSLVLDERPMFDEEIQAWANGPVVPELYKAHRGKYKIEPGDIPGDIETLDEAATKTILAVLEIYGGKSSWWLSQLTHKEPPWKSARAGLSPGERGAEPITLDSMAEYYGSLA